MTFDRVIANPPFSLDEWGREVAESDANGWTYDDTYQNLYFHGSAVPNYGTTITVAYEVAGARTEDSGG